ncbi:MAG: DUF262 domain-containing protein [Pyrobaculum sp.]
MVQVMTPLITVKNYLNLVRTSVVLDPVFQRNVVWDRDKMTRYVSHLLEGYGQLSVIVLGRIEKEDKYFIVDGLNRTASIMKFFSGEIPIYIGGRAYYIDSLDSELKAKLENSQLLVAMVSASSMEEIVHIFQILNMAQAKLSIADVVLARRAIDSRYRLVYDFANELCPVAKRISPRLDCKLFAFAVLYYIIEKKARHYESVRQKIWIIERWKEEEIRKAIELARTLDYSKVRTVDDLPVLVLSTVRGMRPEDVEKELAGELVSQTAAERAIEILYKSFASCVSQFCSKSRSALYAKADPETKRELKKLIKLLISMGVCAKYGSSLRCHRSVLDILKGQGEQAPLAKAEG